MAVERVKIVNENGKVGWVAATYPPLVHGRLQPAPSARAKRRRSDEPPTESAEPQAPAAEPSNITEES
jgi:hypothetical protein